MMKKHLVNIISIVLICSLCVFTYSCKHDSITKEQPQICFDTEVLPIFQTGCAISGCHDSGARVQDLDYSNYNSIMATILAGKPDRSQAYTAMIALNDQAMPPNAPLSLEARTTIRLWIEQGAQNTNCSNGGGIITTPEPDPSVCFSRDVLPILQSTCATTGCHDQASRVEGLVLTNYASVMAANELVRPFSANRSELVKVLTASGENLMPPPPYPKLNSQQIATITEWINNGAKNDECVSLCDTTVFTFSGAVETIITNNCKGCHSGSSPYGGVSLTSYAEIKVIADDNRLIETIKALNGRPLMPTSQSLPDCQIQQIEKWIEAGALNN